MHSTGENVQCTPVADTSSAVARPAACTFSESHVVAMPNCSGKMVAPGQKE